MAKSYTRLTPEERYYIKERHFASTSNHSVPEASCRKPSLR